MKTFKIDDKGDLVIDGQNNFAMVEGTEEEKQSIKILLETSLGEWFLNLNHGLNYEPMREKNPDLLAIRESILNAFTQEQRIIEVISLEIDFDRSKRKLTVKFELKMISGNTIQGGESF